MAKRTTVAPNSGNQAVADAAASLASFLSKNTSSSIDRRGRPTSAVVVSKPWGDDSFVLKLDGDHNSDLVQALNNVILPERFSAIYHVDIRRLEVLWTAFPLSGFYEGIPGREFEFCYKGLTYGCQFASASDRAVTIGHSFEAITTSDKNYRNVQSFSLYAKLPPNVRSMFSETGPISFWISCINEWDEQVVVDLVSNLNFYLTYYDTSSPVILIHDTQIHPDISRLRYLKGDFPLKINGRPLDDNLLTFWNFINGDYGLNAMVQFILYYCIIEYAAFSYVEGKIRSDIKKLVTSPNFDPYSKAVLDDIVSAIPTSTSEEITRFRAVVSHCVSPKVLWPEVEKNKAFFSNETRFDGGFSIKPIISNSENEQTFIVGRIASFSEAIRKIRNTLSHGKDQETAGVILPTLRNFNLLRSWLHLIATAAGEVVLHKDIT